MIRKKERITIAPADFDVCAYYTVLIQQQKPTESGKQKAETTTAVHHKGHKERQKNLSSAVLCELCAYFVNFVFLP